jgi:ComF family protein
MLSTKYKTIVNEILARWYQLTRRSRDWLAGECLICAQPVKTLEDICLACRNDIPLNQNCCVCCAEPLDTALVLSLTCKQCQEQPPAFDQVIAPLLYAPPIDALLLRFKSHTDRTAGSLLVDLLVEALQSKIQELEANALLAIPSQKDRQKKRGINPPAWLGQRLAWQSQLPFRPDWLKRCRNIPSQQELSRKNRWLNPQEAFIASREVEGKKLLLVDDVMTTGATCHWAALELKAKGAASVTVIAACRTPF